MDIGLAGILGVCVLLHAVKALKVDNADVYIILGQWTMTVLEPVWNINTATGKYVEVTYI